MSTAAPVKVGVIGVGALGTHHVRLHAANPAATLVGVYDADTARAQALAAEHHVRAFASAEELAAAVDAVSVAVPTDLHHAVVAPLLRAKKHVLVEKPLAATVAHGRELVALAKEHGVVLMVGHVERFNPVITYLETRIHQPLFIEAHRLANFPPPRPGQLPRGTEVGVVLDLMIHDLDIILYLVNSPVERCEAVGLPVLTKHEDLANARITFANGCVANVTASRVSPEKMRKIRVFQPDGYMSLDYGTKQGELYTRAAGQIQREQLVIEDANALQAELEDFIRSVHQVLTTGAAPDPSVPGEHGLKALELGELIVNQVRANLLDLAKRHQLKL